MADLLSPLAKDILNRASLPAVFVAAATGGSKALLDILIAAENVEEKCAELRAVTRQRTDPEEDDALHGPDENVIGHSPAEVAASANHVEFLNTWNEKVGRLHLGACFQAALEGFADRTFEFMLLHRDGLISSNPADRWGEKVRSRKGARDFLLDLLASEQVMGAQQSFLYSGRIENSYRVLYEHVFSKFTSYPNLDDQRFSYNSGSPIVLYYDALRTRGARVLLDKTGYNHGPTPQTYRYFMHHLFAHPRVTEELRLVFERFPPRRERRVGGGGRLPASNREERTRSLAVPRAVQERFAHGGLQPPRPAPVGLPSK
ncbi:hypothetical protein DFJ74DRAFT_654368 [Hyaloraphidium curvatum]|nr:hypothetical protein DFJ74DRAFT_654368 [Hyaloraphidium curvatum]